MLTALQIRDVVLIESMELEFFEGLSVLTGETGAGKSIILDALGLATGARADKGLVRAGAKMGSVTAQFELDHEHPAQLFLEEHGFKIDEASLILRRVISSDGRARAFVNDEPCSQSLLQALGALLVEIHGQFEGENLAEPAHHRGLLDHFAGLAVELEQTSACFRRWRDATEACAAHETALADAARDAAYVAHALQDLNNLNPKDGEETALVSERAQISHGAKAAEALQDALGQLTRDGTIAGRLSQALRRLERAAEKAGSVLNPALEVLGRALSETTEAEAVISALLQGSDFDPRRLEWIETRLADLRAAARKFSAHPDTLASLRASFEARHASVEEAGETANKLQMEAKNLREIYVQQAAQLRAKRAEAAKKLDIAIAKELRPLKLERATFKTEFVDLNEPQWSASGTERVQFLVSTNPGVPMGPLNRIASGGERARFFLALKVVLAKDGNPSTLIFDEVDQGVGGAVAAAVGERLSRLSRAAQVLLVTHSPQIAARADHHYKIAKAAHGKSDRSLTTGVWHLSMEARREEIARMLSGAEITNEARAAAEKLIAARA